MSAAAALASAVWPEIVSASTRVSYYSFPAEVGGAYQLPSNYQKQFLRRWTQFPGQRQRHPCLGFRHRWCRSGWSLRSSGLWTSHSLEFDILALSESNGLKMEITWLKGTSSLVVEASGCLRDLIASCLLGLRCNLLLDLLTETLAS